MLNGSEPKASDGHAVTLRSHAAENGALVPFFGPLRGRFREMPNIRQQKKRVRTAAEQRLENLRYGSTIKTLTKRLAAAVADGDAATIDAEHNGLVKLIDRAVARGAIHRNTAARKKSQAARLVGSRQ